MGFKLLAGENVDFRIVEELIKKGFNVISVLKTCPGIPDKEVLELSKREKALL